jgi:hypothetical protein
MLDRRWEPLLSLLLPVLLLFVRLPRLGVVDGRLTWEEQRHVAVRDDLRIVLRLEAVYEFIKIPGMLGQELDGLGKNWCWVSIWFL